LRESQCHWAAAQWHWLSLKFCEKTGEDLGGRGSGRAAERWSALRAFASVFAAQRGSKKRSRQGCGSAGASPSRHCVLPESQCHWAAARRLITSPPPSAFQPAGRHIYSRRRKPPGPCCPRLSGRAAAPGYASALWCAPLAAASTTRFHGSLPAGCRQAAQRASSLLTSRFSLLASHFSLLASHFSLLTSRFSLLTSHFSLLTSHFSLLTSARRPSSPLHFLRSTLSRSVLYPEASAQGHWLSGVSHAWEDSLSVETPRPDHARHAVDVNRPVRHWCAPPAPLVARLRAVTGGLTSPARLSHFLRRLRESQCHWVSPWCLMFSSSHAPRIARESRPLGGDGQRNREECGLSYGWLFRADFPAPACETLPR
jgi:hypothetical protein